VVLKKKKRSYSPKQKTAKEKVNSRKAASRLGTGEKKLAKKKENLA